MIEKELGEEKNDITELWWVFQELEAEYSGARGT